MMKVKGGDVNDAKKRLRSWWSWTSSKLEFRGDEKARKDL